MGKGKELVVSVETADVDTPEDACAALDGDSSPRVHGLNRRVVHFKKMMHHLMAHH